MSERHPPFKVGWLKSWLRDNQIPGTYVLTDQDGSPIQSFTVTEYWNDRGLVGPAIALQLAPYSLESHGYDPAEALTIDAFLAQLEAQGIPDEHLLVDAQNRAFRDLGESSWHPKMHGDEELDSIRLQLRWG